MPAAESPNRFPHVEGLPRVHSGKVRDTYAVDQSRLLIVASDRISAFDVILPTGISFKGPVLNTLSAFWFVQTATLISNHLISTNLADITEQTGIAPEQRHLAGRSSLVRRAERIDIECVVRGYLAGSGWVEYRDHGTLAGLRLPTGMLESQKLPDTAFTPAIKNDAGHDQNISVQQLEARVGRDMARQLEDASRAVYSFAADFARSRDLIIADTKMEFGIVNGHLLLIDELLTPDSSRFWDAETYKPGGAQTSYDKQPVRDYLDASGWKRDPPAPTLPDDVANATTERYLSAYKRISGHELDVESH